MLIQLMLSKGLLCIRHYSKFKRQNSEKNLKYCYSHVAYIIHMLLNKTKLLCIIQGCITMSLQII